MRVSRLVVAVPMLCLVLVPTWGCTDQGPDSGALSVSLTTTGADPDPDGYTVSVDGGTKQAVGTNGSVTFAAIAPGGHTVRLDGLEANCSVNGGNNRNLIVVGGQEVTATFAVSCAARVGGIAVSVAWTGVDIDPEGYIVSVDDGIGQPLGTNATVTIPGLGPGKHTVRLNDVPSNCTVGGANPQTVTVVFGETASVGFPVTCVAGVGGLRVTTATAGSEIDPDGYTVEVATRDDEGFTEVIVSAAIGANASVTFPALRVGTYTVYLEYAGVAPNCTVAQPAEPLIRVRDGGTAAINFTIQCLATGNLRVTNVTSGPDPDPDGYTVRIWGARFSRPVSLASGGTATIPSLPVGSYSAVIDGVAENCDPVGPDTVRAAVVAQTTATIALDVACTPVTHLAFVSERNGNPEIYAVNSSGTGLTRLTTNAARDLDPAWSPDGRRIAFTSDRSGTPEIWLMDANGSNVVRRTNTGAPNSHPSWSPDGRRLAFVSTRDGNAEVYTIAADDDGSAEVRLTTNPGLASDPAWSPDGSKIAFASDRNGSRDIYVMNADGSGVTRLTQSSGESWYSQPAWSPDGKRIAAVWTARCGRDCYDGDDPEILVMNADGSGYGSSWKTLLLPARDDAAIAWSPDGRTLAFSALVCVGLGCPNSIDYARVDRRAGGLIVSDGYSPSWRR